MHAHLGTSGFCVFLCCRIVYTPVYHSGVDMLIPSFPRRPPTWGLTARPDLPGACVQETPAHDRASLRRHAVVRLAVGARDDARAGGHLELPPALVAHDLGRRARRGLHRRVLRRALRPRLLPIWLRLWVGGRRARLLEGDGGLRVRLEGRRLMLRLGVGRGGSRRVPGRAKRQGLILSGALSLSRRPP